MDNTFSIPPDEGWRGPLVRFFRQLADLAATTARELELGERTPARPRAARLEDLDLGSLQAPIIRVPSMNTDEGAKPRAITEQIGRSDEPNVRIALRALAKRGIVELVPGSSPQRWRLSDPFRTG